MALLVKWEDASGQVVHVPPMVVLLELEQTTAHLTRPISTSNTVSAPCNNEPLPTSRFEFANQEELVDQIISPTISSGFCAGSDFEAIVADA